MIKSIDLSELDIKTRHGHLLGAVGPRPIAFASTADTEGNPNLSPFSFFNAFGSNPPTLIFSPARRGRDNTTKHTLHNVQATREVVINVVNYAIVQQASLSSTEYAEGINEFEKAGLTELPSEVVKPPRVKESPVQMECEVKDIIAMGDQGAAGNLVICEVKMMHINENVLDKNGNIDQEKIDLTARMGGNFYCRAHGDALFEVEKPLQKLGIGIDQIPQSIRESAYLTGNDLGKLGNVEKMPPSEEVEQARQEKRVQDILQENEEGLETGRQLHLYAHELLKENKVHHAWTVLLNDKRTQN